MGRLNRAMGGLLVTLVLLSPCGNAPAASKKSNGELSAQEAAALVQRQTGGQALGVREAIVDGRKVYRVRVVTDDGRVREITVDAGSGDR